MDGFEDNLFFAVLTSKFPQKYQEVVQNCYTLCVPANGSYNSKQLTESFISLHILKPSPLLKSHFIPCNNKQNFHVQFGSNNIQVRKGFGDENVATISILAEQKAYDNANKFYKLYLIDGPLVSSTNSTNLNYKTATTTSQEVELVSSEDCDAFIRSLSLVDAEKLERKVTTLFNALILLPEFIEDVSQRLKRLINESIETFEVHCESRRQTEILPTMLESFCIGAVYDRLMHLTCEKFTKSDGHFLQKVKQIFDKHLNPVDFGAQSFFANFAVCPQIVHRLAQLRTHRTPFAKVNCMRLLLDQINEQLKKTVEQSRSPLEPHSDTVYIMSDDLIATVICVLVHTNHLLPELSLCSEIAFIKMFSSYLPQNSELGYSLVTFEVAIGFIQSFVTTSGTGIRKQNSNNGSPKPLVRRATHPRVTRTDSLLDREIEKISQLVHCTPSELIAPKRSRDELGGFLGSLAGDYLTTSGNKNI